MTTSSLRSPLVGTVVAVKVLVGDVIAAGTEIVVIESMKMEHPVLAETSCRISALFVTVGQSVGEGEVLAECVAESVSTREVASTVTGSGKRADLEHLRVRQNLLRDESRSEAVAKRHSKGQRTARENVCGNRYG